MNYDKNEKQINTKLAQIYHKTGSFAQNSYLVQTLSSFLVVYLTVSFNVAYLTQKFQELYVVALLLWLSSPILQEKNYKSADR